MMVNRVTLEGVHDPLAVEDRLRRNRDRAEMTAAQRLEAANQDGRVHWFAVATTNGRALSVADVMRKDGIEAWCPVHKIKRRKPGTTHRRTVVVARFDGYLFVRMRAVASAVHGLLTFDHVHGVVGRGAWPIIVPDKIIGELQVFGVLTAKQRRLICGAVERGDRVLLPNSAFADMPGVVVAADSARGLVDVEIALFGGTTRIREVGLDQIRKLG